MDREEFLEYLELTLIPDLIASGRASTAADFQMAAQFIEDPLLDHVD